MEGEVELDIYVNLIVYQYLRKNAR